MRKTLNAFERLLEGLIFFGYAGGTNDYLHRSLLSLLAVANGIEAASEYKKRSVTKNFFCRAMRFSGPFLECISTCLLLRSEISYLDTPEDNFLKQIDLFVLSMIMGLRRLFSDEQNFFTSLSACSILTAGVQICTGSKQLVKFHLIIAGLFSSVRGGLELHDSFKNSDSKTSHSLLI